MNLSSKEKKTKLNFIYSRFVITQSIDNHSLNYSVWKYNLVKETRMIAPAYQLLRIRIFQYVFLNFNHTMCELNGNDDSFLYFAYGSNLLAKRLRYSNPSAEFYDIGVLENYRLDFLRYSKRWGGAPATIVPTENSSVWGTIWKMSKEHIKTLDKQEGVHNGIYFSLDVDVKNEYGTVHRCRVYRMTENIDKHVPLSVLPEERRPSLIYLSTMIRGAQDCGLPNDYIDTLKSIKHNGEESFTVGIKKIGLQECDIRWT